MPLYRNNNRIVFFAHIPKTGGTSIENTLRNSGASEALKTPGEKPLGNLNFSLCSLQHLHAELYQKYISPGFYDYAFAVVRNPYSRLASEYRWHFRNKYRPGRTFDRWVQKNIRKVKGRPYSLDNHLRPQVEFLGDNVEVFHFENGLEAPINKALDFLELGVSDTMIIHEKNSGSQAPLQISSATKTIVQTQYHADFLAFGYDPDTLPDDLQEVNRRPFTALFSNYQLTENV